MWLNQERILEVQLAGQRVCVLHSRSVSSSSEAAHGPYTEVVDTLSSAEGELFMSAKATVYVWEHSPYKATKKLIHLAIADVSNEENGNKLWMSQQGLAEKAGCSRKAVNEALAEMVKDGYLKLLQDNSKQNHPNVYRFLCPVEVSPIVTPTDDEVSPLVTPGVTFEDARCNESLLVTKRTQEELKEHTAAFEKFWAAYPRKVSKPAARNAYGRAAKRTDVALIADGLELWIGVWKRDGTEDQFIPHASTWLNGERWNDQVPAAKKSEALKGNAQAGKDYMGGNPLTEGVEGVMIFTDEGRVQ